MTTPESLYLLLTSNARQALASVETVIVDEIHALVPTKRGSRLAHVGSNAWNIFARESCSASDFRQRSGPWKWLLTFLGGVDLSNQPVVDKSDEAEPGLPEESAF